MGVIIQIEKANRIIPAMRRGIVSALNKTMTKAQTDANKKVREIYNIKASDLKSKVKFKKASLNNAVSSFSVTGSRFTLLRFATGQNAKGVSVKIRKDRGTRTILHAFLGVTKGRLQVLSRYSEGKLILPRKKNRKWGEPDLPIEVLTTTGPVKMFAKEAEPAVEKSINKNLFPLIDHEIGYRLSKI